MAGAVPQAHCQAQADTPAAPKLTIETSSPLTAGIGVVAPIGTKISPGLASGFSLAPPWRINENLMPIIGPMLLALKPADPEELAAIRRVS